ncbi:MAG: hypothetical protein D6751_10665 [Deltaproteobacteria bacterium]|nr:MAG: hypothetical protein D6751_10665 [Deltaproteobacteria bacterium]
MEDLARLASDVDSMLASQGEGTASLRLHRQSMQDVDRLRQTASDLAAFAAVLAARVPEGVVFELGNGEVDLQQADLAGRLMGSDEEGDPNRPMSGEVELF